MKLPIELYQPVITKTATGGTTESYTLFSADFAEVSEVKSEKSGSAFTSGQSAGGVMVAQDKVKRFKIDYRPSLNITQKWLIKYEGVSYTITSIAQRQERRFKYLIEAKARL